MASVLFQPVKIKDLELRNRFVRSATAEGMASSDGQPTPQLKDLYCALAENEVGLIETCGATIEAWQNLPETIGVLSPFSMHEDRYIEPWQDLIKDVHSRGAKMAMQLVHLGRQDLPQLRGAAPLAPSAVKVEATGVVPQEMTQDDIQQVIDKYAQACGRVKQAGFDAVNFHGAHGNLINNFMSPFTNRRTDQYGGSTQNRARFVVEMVQAVRRVVGPDFPLILKMNFDDFFDGGLNQQDAVDMAAIIAEAGMDCIEVSGGTLSETPGHVAVKGIAKPEQEAYFQFYAKALKPRVDVPVMLVGGLRSPAVMEKIIQDGAADLIALSRPFIREPGLIKRWAQGDREKAKCVSCNQCFENFMFRPLRCYVEQPLEETT